MTRTYKDSLGYALFQLVGYIPLAVLLGLIIIGLYWDDWR